MPVQSQNFFARNNEQQVVFNGVHILYQTLGLIFGVIFGVIVGVIGCHWNHFIWRIQEPTNSRPNPTHFSRRSNGNRNPFRWITAPRWDPSPGSGDAAAPVEEMLWGLPVGREGRRCCSECVSCHRMPFRSVKKHWMTPYRKAYLLENCDYLPWFIDIYSWFHGIFTVNQLVDRENLTVFRYELDIHLCNGSLVGHPWSFSTSDSSWGLNAGECWPMLPVATNHKLQYPPVN